MQAAVQIFVNGIVGVFFGLAVLYAAIKLNKVVAPREETKTEE